MLFLTRIYNEYTLQDAVNAEPSPVTLDQGNVEPLRNETSTDVGAATEAGPRGDSSPQNQGDSTDPSLLLGIKC